MARLFHPSILLACGLASQACGPEARTPGDASTRDAGASDGGGAASDAGLQPSDTPLVERPLERRASCAVAAAVAKHAPLQWASGGRAMVAREGEAVLIRTESAPPSPFEPAPVSLVLGGVASDGALGPATPLAALPDFGAGEPVAVQVGEGLLVVWNEAETLRAAVVDARGTVGPRTLAGLLGSPGMRKSLAEGHGGAGLVYTTGDVAQTSLRLSFAPLDARGGSAGPVVVLEESLSQDPAPALVSTAGGWALTYRDERGVVFRSLAADGAPGMKRALAVESGGAWVARGSGFDRPQLALLATASGFLAAWVEADALGGSGGRAGVRVARLAADGAVVDGPAWVRAPTARFDDAEPRLSHYRDSVALTWAHGTHIEICGGCVPDHALELLLLDPVTLRPQAEVVSLPPGMTGGLLRREEVWIQDELRLAFEITLHVSSDPGTAVLRCAP